MSKLKVNEIYKHSGSLVTIKDPLSCAAAVTLGAGATFTENVTMEKDLDVVGNLDVTGYAIISGGYITLGDADSDRLSLHADITSDIIPDNSNTYDLGTPIKKWNYVHFSTLSGGDNSAISVSAVDATDGTFLNNITVGGTVDGRDISADGAALDTVPATNVAAVSYTHLTLPPNTYV